IVGVALSPLGGNVETNGGCGASESAGHDSRSARREPRAMTTEILWDDGEFVFSRVRHGTEPSASEEGLDLVVETLMMTALQHAGAERGLLIVRRGEETRVEAEATTQRNTVTVHLVGTAAAGANLPDTVLNYVLRTHEAVIVDDATVESP